MHPSGFREVLVFTPAEMDGLDPAIHAVRIGACVGNRRRLVLQEQAMSAGLKLLNPRDIQAREPEADEE
jgi:large subunit ribosomal protein L32e